MADERMKLYEQTIKRLARCGIKDPTNQIIWLADEIERYRTKIHGMELHILKLAGAGGAAKWNPAAQPPPMQKEIIEDGFYFAESAPVLAYTTEETMVVVKRTQDIPGDVAWVEVDGTEYTATHWMQLPEPPQKGGAPL